MARPQTISDERLLSAASTVIGRFGPAFTLAAVAEEAGVAVGSVAQRFGSKADLLRALSEAGTRRTVEQVRAVAAEAGDPRAALREALVAVYSALDDADTAANHLGQLGVDIADPELRRLLGEQYAALESELRALVVAAAAEGWHGPEPDVAARTLLVAANGVALDWAIRPTGTLAARIAETTDVLTGGW